MCLFDRERSHFVRERTCFFCCCCAFGCLIQYVELLCSSKQSSVRSHRGRDMMFFIRERKLLDQPVPAPTLPIHEDNKASGIEGNSRASTESSSEEAGTILDKAMSNVATVGETLADFAARLAPHLLLCPRPVGVSSSSESAELLLQTVDHLEEVLEGQRTAINTQRKMFDQLIDSHFSHLEWEPPLADVPAASSPLKALNSSIHHKNSLCIGDKVLIFATGYVPSFRQFLPLQYMHWQCIGDIRQSHGRVQVSAKQAIYSCCSSLPLTTNTPCPSDAWRANKHVGSGATAPAIGKERPDPGNDGGCGTRCWRDCASIGRQRLV